MLATTVRVVESLRGLYRRSAGTQPQKTLLWLGLAIFALVQMRLVASATGPNLFFDEAIYAENARALSALDFESLSFHYPPLYSVALAFAAGWHNSYVGFLVISNCVALIQVVIAFSIAQRLGSRRPVVPALMVGLLPYQASHAQFLMAENLSGTLFLGFCLATQIRDQFSRRAAQVLLGAALVTTKYLFLPFVIGLLAWEVVVALRSRSEPQPQWRARKSAGLLVGGLISIYVALLATGQVPRLMRYVDRLMAVDEVTVFWLSVSAATLVLAQSAPIAAMLAFRGAGKSEPGPSRLVRVLLTASIAGIAVAALHHGGAGYNAEISINNRFHGRYVSHLVPALLIYGVVRSESVVLDLKQRVLRVALAAGALSLSYGIVFRGFWRDFPRWGSSMSVINPDISVLDHAALPWLLLVAILGLLSPAGRSATGRESLAIATSVVLFFMAADRATQDVTSYEGRELAVHIKQHEHARSSFEVVSGVTQEYLDWQLRFLGYVGSATVLTHDEVFTSCDSRSGIAESVVLPTRGQIVSVEKFPSSLSSRLLLRRPLMTFEVTGLKDAFKPLDGQEIESYGPSQIFAGEPFNEQPDGLSAIWVLGAFPPVVDISLNGGQRAFSGTTDGRLLTFRVLGEDVEGERLTGEIRDRITCALIGSLTIPIETR